MFTHGLELSSLLSLPPIFARFLFYFSLFSRLFRIIFYFYILSSSFLLMSSLTSLPFSNLTNTDLQNVFSPVTVANNAANDIRQILVDSLTDSITDSLEFKYYTPAQLSNLADKYKNSFR